jgi:MtN3 and saliva related transmembrane protein
VLVVLGAVASSFSLSATVPQVVRAFRSRSAEGVSWDSVLLNLVALVLWCVYSATVVDRVQLVNNTVSFALLLVLAVALLRAGGRSWGAGTAGAVAAVVVAGSLAVTVVDAFGPFVLAMIGTLISSVRMWPQARLALSRAPLWGLDPWATALGWVGWLLWTCYGLLAADHAVAVCSLAGLVMQSTIAAFRLPPRRTLHSIAGGRLGPVAARVAVPVSDRFPLRAGDYELVA